MINENNINKYGLQSYKEAFDLIQNFRGQGLMIIKELRGRTGLQLADVKTIIDDISNNEEAYKQYLYSRKVTGATDSII